ncbi:hypothetical protein OXX79_010727 [Metschnikowia pulcherrima]
MGRYKRTSRSYIDKVGQDIREINEVLNLTYKLEKNESLGETKSFTEQNPAIGTNSKPVDITVRVRVEKQSNDDPAKWIHVTREISTT